MNKGIDSVKNKLEELEYFKYVEEENKDLVIADTFSDYSENGVIKFPWKGLNRTFSIDAESIFESGGIKDQIEGMLNLFQSIEIDLSIGKCIEEFDSDLSIYSKRIIELNGKEYDSSGTIDWGSAFNSGFKLVDQILREFGKDERVFGLFMDEASVLIILTDAQFHYLLELIPEGSLYRPIDLRQMMIEFDKR